MFPGLASHQPCEPPGPWPPPPEVPSIECPLATTIKVLTAGTTIGPDRPLDQCRAWRPPSDIVFVIGGEVGECIWDLNEGKVAIDF